MKYQRLFSIEENTLKAIASQKRLEIIQLLKNRELSVNEIVEMLGIRQANLSQHLSVLRAHGIVTDRKQGLSVYYSLTDPKIAQALELIREFLTEQNRDDPAIADIINASNLYPVVQDPVCGMRLSISEVGGSYDFQARTYYFCAAGCREKFMAHPEQYINTEIQL